MSTARMKSSVGVGVGVVVSSVESLTNKLPTLNLELK